MQQRRRNALAAILSKPSLTAQRPALRELLREREAANAKASVIEAKLAAVEVKLEAVRTRLVAERRASRIGRLSQFIPNTYREGFLDDLMEDATEWAEQGMTKPRIWWRVAVQVAITVANRPLLWRSAGGAWFVGKLKPLIGGE